MLNIWQNSFLSSIGITIVWSFAELGILWLLYILIAKQINQNTTAKYFIAFCFQIIGFITTLFTFFYFLQRHEIQFSTHLLNLSNNSIASRTLTIFPTLFSSLALIYLLLLIKHIVTFYKQLYAVSEIKFYPNSFIELNFFQQFINEQLKKLNIKTSVELLISNKSNSPFTIGIFKPVILLPVSMFTYLSQEQIEAVLLHELAHIKRKDYLVNMIVCITELLLFFNPFMKLLGEETRNNRELLCDDYVLANNEYSKLMYAEALLQIAKNSSIKQPTVTLNAAQQNFHLLHRIQYITSGYFHNRVFSKKKTLLLSCLLVITIIIGFNFPVKIKDTELAQTSRLYLTKVSANNHLSVQQSINNRIIVKNKISTTENKKVAQSPAKIVSLDDLINVSGNNEELTTSSEYVFNIAPDSLKNFLSEEIINKLSNRLLDKNAGLKIIPASILKKAIVSAPSVKVIRDTILLNGKKEIISLYTNTKGESFIQISYDANGRFY